MAKQRVGIVFGGKSAEHEVSLQSAKNIVDAIDKSRFDVVLLGIDKQGQWHVNDASQYLLNAHDPAHIALNPSEISVATVPGVAKGQLIDAGNAQALAQIDVVFPIVHGTLGKMVPCRGCCAWPTCRSSARTYWAPPPAWTKTSPNACCAMPG
jgi:D-alanine-D-alanine ligase